MAPFKRYKASSSASAPPAVLPTNTSTICSPSWRRTATRLALVSAFVAASGCSRTCPACPPAPKQIVEMRLPCMEPLSPGVARLVVQSTFPDPSGLEGDAPYVLRASEALHLSVLLEGLVFYVQSQYQRCGIGVGSEGAPAPATH